MSQNVPVQMTVTAPATWGKLTGNVSTQGYCDASPAVLAGVTVTVQSAASSWTFVTDATGQYNRWLDQSYSPLTITVNIPGYQFAQVTGVNIAGQGDDQQRLLVALVGNHADHRIPRPS